MSDLDSRAPDDAALAATAETLGEALRARGMRLAAAESCTGGWIAKLVTDVPGASDWFDRSFVTYSDQSKIDMLGVRAATLAAEGAVSESVVSEMAAGAKRLAACEAAVAVSGIAGPGGATPGKPVGLVWFAWSLAERDWTARREFRGDRAAVRRSAVDFALQQLLDALTD
ncbi:MAG: nicotinamide-nucleotide amidohydrolase family protein [Gammaproteobacteria bacterium]|nr:nicotinamide-nucleotide amidohydrolase family protein [Gammaproteobacteria bacterium]